VTALKRMTLGLGTVVAAVTLSATPAGAIINGAQDTGNIFSSTGLVLNNGQHWCSGVLYRTDHSARSSTTFMTAGHCVLGFSGPFEVTFDPAGDTDPSAQYINVVAKYTIPSYANAVKSSNSLQNGNDVPDVAVLVLAHAPAGITPADLPSAGLVDTLDFNTSQVSVVGYGVNSFTNANNSSSGARYYKNVNIIPGQRAQSADLYLKTGASTCFGDSGGPNFLAGTSIVLGVTSWGQSVTCNDHNYFYRIDNTEALNFLSTPTIGVTS
jgi:trypsin